jgi:hypothetical protein
MAPGWTGAKLYCGNAIAVRHPPPSVAYDECGGHTGGAPNIGQTMACGVARARIRVRTGGVAGVSDSGKGNGASALRMACTSSLLPSLRPSREEARPIAGAIANVSQARTVTSCLPSWFGHPLTSRRLYCALLSLTPPSSLRARSSVAQLSATARAVSVSNLDPGNAVQPPFTRKSS